MNEYSDSYESYENLSKMKEEDLLVKQLKSIYLSQQKQLKKSKRQKSCFGRA